MNKNVFKAMLGLCLGFLVFFYIVKIFIPEQFVFSVQNQRIIAIGEFIDNHRILYYIFSGITAFITYFLFCGAACGRLYFKWYEYIFIIAVIVAARIVNFFDENIATAISVSSFVFLPALMKGHLIPTAITYIVHTFSQSLSLTIRNLTVYLATGNTLTIFLLAIDMYLWLAICYILFNYKKQEDY